MTLKEFKKYALDLDRKRLSAMSPAERREILQRRENDRKVEEEKAKSTVPYLEHEREINDLEQTIDFISDDFHKYANLSLDALKSKQKDLEKARARIDALLDANLKLQNVKLKEIEKAAREGAKSGVAKSLPPLMRKLATSDDPDPLAPKKRAPGAGRPKQNDLDGKQVEDAYKRMAGSPKAQSFTAICANLIRNPPKRRKYQKPYKSAKALFNAVKRAHPDLSDLRP